MSTQPPRRYTVEEYFALEEQSDIRYEYYRGEIFPMDGPDSPENKAGATKRHNRLIQNIILGLRGELGEQPCEVYSENVRLAIDPQEHYNYPDVVVSCDPEDDDPRTVYSPVLIMEVLSKSTPGLELRAVSAAALAATVRAGFAKPAFGGQLRAHRA